MRDHPFLVICGLIAVIISGHVLNGCTAKREAGSPVETTELPVFEGEKETDYLELSVLFLLSEDGSVEDLQLVNSSGDALWDSAAIDSIKNWRFPPTSESEKKWVRRTVRIEIIPAEIINLGELVFRNKNEADLMYSRLRAGVSFERMVRETQQGNTLAREGRFRPDVETAEYPIKISQMLMKLEEGQYSKPVPMDGEYLIFKRYGDYIPEL